MIRQVSIAYCASLAKGSATSTRYRVRPLTACASAIMGKRTSIRGRNALIASSNRGRGAVVVTMPSAT